VRARERCVLTVNAGSSSFRLAAFALEGPVSEVAAQHLSPAPGEPERALSAFFEDHALATPHAVAHRVVNGGLRLTSPCAIDEAVEHEIERLGLLAPLHNPVALAWIRAARRAFGSGIPQIAAFDTRFL